MFSTQFFESFANYTIFGHDFRVRAPVFLDPSIEFRFLRENAYGVSFVWKFMWEKVADDVFEREKVISYFIKYVDEMDALSRCVRYYPLDGVFSTCFGHVEQQSDTMSVKEKNLAQKSHWTWSSHNTRYDMCFVLIVLFKEKWAR